MKTKSLLALAAATIFSLSANATVHFDQLDLGDFNDPSELITKSDPKQAAPFNFTFNHSGSQIIYNTTEIAPLFDHDCSISSITFVYADENWDSYYEFSYDIGVYLQLINESEFIIKNNEYNWFTPVENQSVVATSTFDWTMDKVFSYEPVEVTLTFNPPFVVTAEDKGKSLLVTSYANITEGDPDGQYVKPYAYTNEQNNYRLAAYGYDGSNEDFLEAVEAGATIKSTNGGHSNVYKGELPIARIAYSWDDTPVEEPKEGEEGEEGDTTSIDQVSVNGDASVEYFNLQGMKIDHPAAGQVVIRRAGNTISKVIIR